jgi:hypothetical protein
MESEPVEVQQPTEVKVHGSTNTVPPGLFFRTTFHVGEQIGDIEEVEYNAFLFQFCPLSAPVP